MKPIKFMFLSIILIVCSLTLIMTKSWTPSPVTDDQNLFQPGTQPGETGEFTSPQLCGACHGGYDKQVEPYSNWKGSMMAQAARDPLWLAAVTVTLQDSIYATGNPNAGDICIRCHSPTGWLEERSDPVNMKLLTGMDYEGVHCDFCHRLVDPFDGQPDATRDRDIAVLNNHSLFDGSPFYTANQPTNYGTGALPDYIENTGGQFFADPVSVPRGPREDTTPTHDVYVSTYHSEKEICGVCHDVSNPVLANLLIETGTPEQNAAGSYFHVERTYSEFTLSAYAEEETKSNIPGVETASSCQDCHMPKVKGRSTVISSTETYDDLLQHSFAGGNIWISSILASTDPNYHGYDAYNYRILSGEKYPGASVQVSGLENKGEAINSVAEKANKLLQSAATIEVVESEPDKLILRIHNNAGHKLISGFPEGRRMFLNIKYLDVDGSMLEEANPYEPLLTELDLDGNEMYLSGGDLTTTHEELVWEVKMMSPELTGEENSFHIALATDRYKDNRIPPLGFNTGEMESRLVQPRWAGINALDYFTDDEYNGGFDQLSLTPPPDTRRIEITLYYQTTSKQYMEFLRDEINGDNPTLPEEAYIAQTDAFFDELRGWGDAMWDLWLHNDGAKPVVMTSIDIEFDVETPEPKPEPEPEPEPESEPEPEEDSGRIPGFPFASILIGLLVILFYMNTTKSNKTVLWW